MQIQEKAKIMSRFLERKERKTGESFVYIKDQSPEWVIDICRECHQDMMPDDYKFEMIHEALKALKECKNDQDVDHVYLESDIYTHQLLKWVSSHLTRIDYVDEYMGECDLAQSDFLSLLSGGQLKEKNEVLSILIEELKNLEDLES